MRRPPLLIAFCIVLTANVFALGHAWFNRTGQPDATVTLTQDDLVPWQAREADSGLDVHFGWKGWQAEAVPPAWSARRNMERFGFDYSVPASSPHAEAFYRRQAPRRTFAAVELISGRTPVARIVDIGPDDKALRELYPDRSHIVIIPAVVSVNVNPGRLEIVAGIAELPTGIHVPTPFLTELRNRKKNNEKVSFRLEIHYGRLHEPWVAGMDFPPDRQDK